METVGIICFFILGLVLGSFYNVVGFRLPNKKSFVKGHSMCPTCHHQLAWYELIPLVSYIVQGGKCRHCQSKIAYFYPLVELSTGILFAISYYSFGLSYELLLSLFIVSMLMIIIVSDLMYLIIPDEVLIFFGILIIVVQLLSIGPWKTVVQIGSSALLFLFMFGLMKLGDFLFKTESLGGGDVKLMAIVGLILDPVLGVVVIFVASLVALPVSLFLAWKKKENIIPFGPFLVLALLLIYLTKIDINTVKSMLGI